MPSTLGIVSSHYTRPPASVSLLLRGTGTAVYSDTFSDLSSNVNPITKVGNVLYKNSVRPFSSIQPNGGSAYFDGSSYLTTAIDRSQYKFLHDGTTDWTVEGWFFINNGNGTAIFSTDPASANIGCFLGVNNNLNRDITFSIYRGVGGSWHEVSSSGGVWQYNTWTHFAVTFQTSSKTLRAYINGSVVATNSSPTFAYSSSNSTYPLDIGRSYYSGATSGYLYATGHISNLRFIKGNALYTGSTLTVPTSPLTSIANTFLLLTGEPLNKGNNDEFPDISNNRSHVTISGKPTQAALTPFAGTGGSIYVSSGNRLRIASSPSLNILSGDFTIECFVNVVQMPPSFSVIVGQWRQSVNLGGYNMGVLSNGQLFFSFGANNESANLISTTTKSLTAGITSHVAATRNGSTFSLFIDGQTVGTAVFAGTRGDIGVDTTIGNYLNSSNNFPASVGTDLNAYISNLRIVKGTAVYPTTPFPTGPLGNISGTSLLLSTPEPGVVDSVNKNPVIYTNGNSAITTSVKKYGSGSLYFDGSGDYLTVPATSALAFGTGDFTIEFWCNFTSVIMSSTINARIYSHGLNAASRLQIYIDDDTTYGNPIGGIGLYSASVLAQTKMAINDGTWHHIAFVRLAGTIRTFVDGNLMDTRANNTNFNDLTTEHTIGAYSNKTSGYFNGYIDDFRITRGAIYTKNFAPGPLSELPTTDPINLNLL